MSFDAFRGVACRRIVYSCRESIKKRDVSFFCPMMVYVDVGKVPTYVTLLTIVAIIMPLSANQECGNAKLVIST